MFATEWKSLSNSTIWTSKWLCNQIIGTNNEHNRHHPIWTYSNQDQRLSHYFAAHTHTHTHTHTHSTDWTAVNTPSSLRLFQGRYQLLETKKHITDIWYQYSFIYFTTSDGKKPKEAFLLTNSGYFIWVTYCFILPLQDIYLINLVTSYCL